jgi:N-acetylglucosaminyldiphosphoundecaprenol N-acetyl-beta-D-mannosaminyltransferase
MRDAGEELHSRSIIGMRVDATSYEQAAGRISAWASRGQSRYVCVATVNNAIETRDDPSFRAVMNQADLVTPDGVPLVWGLRLLGVEGATRVYGPDLVPRVCRVARDEGIAVGFYGGTPESLSGIVAALSGRFPGLQVSYRSSPPFRPLRPEEDERVCDEIRRSGVRILFVGLGAPKQERWMAEHRGRVPAVMIGVGAAFDFLAGHKKQAPRWMQDAGLEWAFRLSQEPRRLWKRYLYGNPRFVSLFAAQLLATPRTRRSAGSHHSTSSPAAR